MAADLEASGDPIPAPADPAAWPAWRERLAAWREEARRRRAYDPAPYLSPDFAWAADCVTTHKILLWDERFHDRDRGGYRVDAYVDGFERRFGALDGAILWHAYPNLGFDRRNQFDFYRRMPGGLDGLREAVDRLHRRGVRVLLDYSPWDRGSRREDRPDHEVLAGLMAALDADGLYLDTMAEATADLRAALDAAKPGVVLESQFTAPLDRIGDHHMSWAEAFPDTAVPGVLRNAWYERRHMTHVVRRWMGDRRGDLQLAWMNGAGVTVWENVFGSWNGWSDRDALWLRLWSAVRHRRARRFARGDWTPLAASPADGVFGSTWEAEGSRLWTLVNRDDAWKRGVAVPAADGEACELFSGRRLAVRDGHVRVDLPPRGMAAVDDARVDDGFLRSQAKLWRALAGASDESGPRPVRVVRSDPPVRGAASAGMAARRGARRGRTSAMRRRECGGYASAHAPDCPDRALPGLHETVTLEVPAATAPFAIDRRSVTNAAFLAFLERTGYRPRHAMAFLEDWRDGRPPDGRLDDPVTWVDLGDARAYAAWRGGRLATEAEWQAAAEEGLLDDDPVRVWNWTDPVFGDGRTRFCMLKGGSAFQAAGSDWYADGGPREPAFAAKHLLLWPGLDRCGTVGFRTAVDLEGGGG